jgi:very-short-patch-repair endonuclease
VNEADEALLGERGVDRNARGDEMFAVGFDLIATLLAEPDYWKVESPIERGLYEALRHMSPEVKIRAQVWIGRYRVDLLVEDRLVVECDGRDFHSTPEQQSADRVRDATLKAAGYRVFRLSGSNICKRPYSCAISVLRKVGIIE